MPAAGRTAWNGPAKAPGVTYLYMHSPDPGTTFTLTWMPQGGVALAPFPQGSVRNRLTPDATVVDLRPVPASGYDLAVAPRILGRPMGAPTPRPVGWTAAVEDRGKTLTAATVIVEPGFRDAPADLRLGRKSKDGTTLWRAGDLETAAAASCGPPGAPGDAREQAATLLHCATVRYSMGDNAGALRAFDDALKLGATLAMIRLAYAKVLFDTGDFSAAEAELKRYLAVEPGNQAAMRLLAQFQAAAAGSPARGVGLGQAYQAAVENATDIARAGLKSGEKAAEAAGRVFDRGVTTPPAVAVGSGARPMPPGLANDERMKSLQTQKTKLLDQNAELQKKLDDVRVRKARGEGDRGRLDVEETNLKQQQVGVRGQIGVLEVNIIDLGVKWEEEQKGAAPTPKP
ncbi:MAG: tetratricopeptide repeat protein [Candidatus Rokubacteria bacterium]|nr:tetratricopeptide repeat protein [Candidatus Rokubacteria bacterium]